MSESRIDPASPLTPPSKTRGSCEEEKEEGLLCPAGDGGDSRKTQPKHRKP